MKESNENLKKKRVSSKKTDNKIKKDSTSVKSKNTKKEFNKKENLNNRLSKNTQNDKVVKKVIKKDDNQKAVTSHKPRKTNELIDIEKGYTKKDSTVDNKKIMKSSVKNNKKNDSIIKKGYRRNNHNNINNKNKLIFQKLGYILLGIVICLIFLFFLCGRRNFIKLYYELGEFIEVYDDVTSDYYGELDKQEMINGAIDAMLTNVNDYYTTYIDKDSADSFLENVSGTYEGIGCMISTNIDGEIFVVEVFDDTPSSKAGLLENDVIVKVNNEDYSNKTSLDMSEFVKNSNLKEISLTIKRDNEFFDVIIEREKIEIPVVNSQVLEYDGTKIGYIVIDVFSSVSYEQIKSKLKKLESKGIKGLVIDVRNNNGGYLNAVTDISSLFLKKGQIIYQLKDNNSVNKIKDVTKDSRSYPIAVLVNNGSASASEIFAAAIKESYGGVVVGTNTYGKGTVQKTKSLKDGSLIKYTIQSWLTPDGNFINEVGLVPTNVVELNYDLGYDNQLEEALKLVSNDTK